MFALGLRPDSFEQSNRCSPRPRSRPAARTRCTGRTGSGTREERQGEYHGQGTDHQAQEISTSSGTGERAWLSPVGPRIGEAVGLTSSSTVHAHLAVLQREGYLRRDPTEPRAIEVCYDPSSKVIAGTRRTAYPLVGDVAAGTGVLAHENVEELSPLPEDFTGTGTLFMVRVRGDSMIEAGILDGDFVVVRQQPEAEQGDIVVAGIPDDEATVKQFSHPGRACHPHTPPTKNDSLPWSSTRVRSPSSARWSRYCGGSDDRMPAVGCRDEGTSPVRRDGDRVRAPVVPP